jgi:predicted nuclease of predicted toxin-antitoxin system
MELAVEQGREVVSADTDFGELLAVGGASVPSVILLRRHHDPDDQIRAILGALPDVSDDLAAGAVVVIVRDRLRVRRLPIR